jgi:hypothetical protein
MRKEALLFILFVLVIALMVFMGVYFAFDDHVRINPPTETLRSREAQVQTNSRGDTLVVKVIDTRIYIYPKLTNEQREQLKEAIK